MVATGMARDRFYRVPLAVLLVAVQAFAFALAASAAAPVEQCPVHVARSAVQAGETHIVAGHDSHSIAGHGSHAIAGHDETPAAADPAGEHSYPAGFQLACCVGHVSGVLGLAAPLSDIAWSGALPLDAEPFVAERDLARVDPPPRSIL
jgi:hypothetical protein